MEAVILVHYDVDCLDIKNRLFKVVEIYPSFVCVDAYGKKIDFGRREVYLVNSEEDLASLVEFNHYEMCRDRPAKNIAHFVSALYGIESTRARELSQRIKCRLKKMQII